MFILLAGLTKKTEFYFRNWSLLTLRKMSSSLPGESKAGKNKIAVCQISCNHDKSENFKICKDLIVQACNEGAKVHILHFSFNSSAVLLR
jgi:hypothetical protein